MSHQQSTAASPPGPVRERLPSLRRLLQRIPSEHRRSVAEFWREVRGDLGAAEAEIAALREEVDELRRHPAASVPPSAVATASRPSSSGTVQDRRFAVDQALVDIGREQDDVSDTLLRIHDLDREWATALLRSKRDRSRDGELGCWVAARAAAHPNGYVKINLRNTARPGSSVQIGCQPFMHQLAVVANGEGAQLLATASGDWEVSHLCHNGSCFNPDHLTIEAQSLNFRRQRCNGQFIVSCPCCGTAYNPCSHGAEGMERTCILPKRKLEAGKYHLCGAQGPVAL